MIQENGNNLRRRWLTIRVSRNTLSFSTIDFIKEGECPITYEPYVVKSGISMAANLREALRDAELPTMNFTKVRVMADAPVLMVPVEMFQESTMAQLYHHSFPKNEPCTVLHNVLPDLNTVACFAISRDLKTVIDDHFKNTQFIALLSPVWRHLYQRSFTGARNKLYGYFHDQKVDIFAFQQSRFRFSNQFDVNRAHDALYFLLYVWKQLNLQQEHDELHLVGDIPEREWLIEQLKRYLQKVYIINPTADFNRAPATQIKNMPYDLMTLFTKGR